MKLALGTAQFGQSYGIANINGQVPQSEVSSILRFCEVSGIKTIDTAISYGASETSLGSADVRNFDVITKIQAIPLSCKDITTWLNEEVDNSLARLKTKNLYGLLLHCPEQLLGSNGQKLLNALISLKASGRLKKLVSRFTTQLNWMRYLNCTNLTLCRLLLM